MTVQRRTNGMEYTGLDACILCRDYSCPTKQALLREQEEFDLDDD